MRTIPYILSVIAMAFGMVLCNAQQDNYMSLSFGISQPLSNYSQNSSLKNDGFALRGFVGDYAGAYYLTDYIGVGGSVKFNQNILSEQDAKAELVNLIPNATLEDITNGDINLGYWSVVSFNVGPQLTASVKKFYFDCWAYPGLYIVTSPTLEMYAEINSKKYNTRMSAEHLRFGFDAGAAVRFDLNDVLGLRLFASYLQTSSKGEIISEIENVTGSKDVDKNIDFTKNINIFNAGIGIFYKL